MANRRKNKALRNAKLAVAPRNAIHENKKSEAVNNGTDPFDKSLKTGRKGYALKAQQAGDYRKVGAVIKNYRKENPDSTFKQVYAVLQKRFPWIFEHEEMESSNISSFINNDPLWRNCYFLNSTELMTLAEIRLAEVLEKDDLEDKVIISAYDKLKKYELAEKQLENMTNGDNNTEEDIPTFGFRK